MIHLRIFPAAEEELSEAAAWYDSQRPGLGGEFLDAFEKATDRLRTYPIAWRRMGA
ncbi:MAG: hypothetical protein ACYC26_17040 [Phycisphaerales bacterium]